MRRGTRGHLRFLLELCDGQVEPTTLTGGQETAFKLKPLEALVLEAQPIGYEPKPKETHSKKP